MSDQLCHITLTGIDDSGKHAPGGAIELELAPMSSTELTSMDIEHGNINKGLSGSFGDGEGKWRIVATSDQNVKAMSLLQTGDGKITNIVATVPKTDGVHQIILVNNAVNSFYQSFIRFINISDHSGEIMIQGVGDEGTRSPETARLSIGPNESIHLSVVDIENGNESKGLTGNLGLSNNRWHIEITPSSGISLKIMNLMRTADGFVTNLSEVVPQELL